MSTKIGQSTKHAPLGQVIQDDINRNKYATRKISGMAFSRRMNGDGDGEEEGEGEGMEEEMLDEKTSRKIIDMGIEQQREVMEEDAAKQRVVDNGGSGMSSLKKKKKSNRLKNNDDSSDEDEDDSDDGSDNNEEDDDELVVEHDNSGYVNISSTNIGLTPEEEALLSNMMGNTKSSSGGGMEEEEEPQRRNLADIIMAKIEEKEALVHAKQQYGNDVNVEEIEEIGIDLPPKVVQVSSMTTCVCVCVCLLGSYLTYSYKSLTQLQTSCHPLNIYPYDNTGLY